MRNSFLKLLNGYSSNEVIWTADITYWISGCKARGAADPDWDTETGYLRLHNDIGIMPYYYYEKFWVAEPKYAPEVGVLRETNANRTTCRIQTPVGALISESAYLPESCCQGTTKHFVESETDLDILLYALEHRRLEPANLYDYHDRLKLWEQYDGLPSIALPRAPFVSFCYEWSDIQNAVYLLADCEDKVRALLRLMESQEDPILEAVCDVAPPLIHFADNLSSDNLAGLYDEWLAPSHEKRLAKLHAVGTKCAVHLDGAVKGLLPKLAAIGFDAIEALTPMPVGDIDVLEMAAFVADKPAILWGGVPGTMFAPPYTWNDMKRHVQHVLESWGGRPFVLGVADQVPPDGDIEFCRKIAELIRGQ